MFPACVISLLFVVKCFKTSAEFIKMEILVNGVNVLQEQGTLLREGRPLQALIEDFHSAPGTCSIQFNALLPVKLSRFIAEWRHVSSAWSVEDHRSAGNFVADVVLNRLGARYGDSMLGELENHGVNFSPLV